MPSQYSIKFQNEPYFLTLNIVEWIDLFTNHDHRQTIVQALKYCCGHKGLVIHAWCLMHNQLLLVAHARKNARLSAILRDFKKYTSKKLLRDILQKKEPRRLWVISRLAHVSKPSGRITYFKLWQDGGVAELLTNPQTQAFAVSYIHNQPVYAKLVNQSIHYIFSSARDYAGYKGVVPLK